MTRISRMLILLLVTLLCGCQVRTKMPADDAVVYSRLLLDWNTLVTDLMVSDGFNPLLASRAYVYPNIASYAALRNMDTAQYPALEGRLNGLSKLPQPEPGKAYCYPLSAIKAYAVVAKKLVYKEKDCQELLEKQIAFFKDSIGVGPDMLSASLAYGSNIADSIIAWAVKDGYPQLKGKPAYLFSTEKGKWVPTPPEFRPSTEPYWGTLRTWSGINPDEVAVPFTIPFSEEKGSDFYNLVNHVYTTAKALTKEQENIALYWDDNPDQMTYNGHIPTPRRRINPVGHWMAISSQACGDGKLGIMKTSQCMMLTSIAIADGLVCCWKQKYTNNLIRPVTYVRKNIDQDWMPLIATPPFPEHTSGHSTISAAAATILAKLFSENHAFTDHALIPFGLPERSFPSFRAAADEASISRVYGGIHYQTGVDGGAAQGRKTGKYVIQLFLKPK